MNTTLSEQIVNDKNMDNTKLEFTGNWFIDAGMLGFVNLMEEVYGWDLAELNQRISDNKDLVYYGYFPLAYAYQNFSNIQLSKIRDPEAKKDIKNELKDIKDMPEMGEGRWTNAEDIFKNAFEHIVKKSYKLTVELKLMIIDKKEDKKKKKVSDIEEEFNKKVIEIQNIIKNNENEIREALNKKKKQKILYYEIEKIKNNGAAEKIKSLREELLKKFEETNPKNENFFRLPLSNKFFTNFLFFQPGWDLSKQEKAFYSVIKSDDSVNELKNIGKTLNKFLLTQKDFNNEFYTSALPVSMFQNIKFIFVYLLCFDEGFVKNNQNNPLPRSFLFYSPNLNFSHKINKKLKIFFNQQDKKYDLLKITLNQVIDSLYEHQSKWSLESMYIIQYDTLDNQKQEGVEFIGIPKIQAVIIMDDTIRENLNKSIPYRKKAKGKFEYSWILQELMKGKPLSPIILNHLTLKINEEYYLSLKSSIYALAVDKCLRKVQKSIIFNQDFFKNHDFIVDEIKRTASIMSLNKNCIFNLFPNKDENKRLSYELLATIKCKDKNSFLNVLSKELINKNGKGKEKLIELYIQKNIVQNDISWECYALPLIMGLVV